MQAQVTVQSSESTLVMIELSKNKINYLDLKIKVFKTNECRQL